MDADDISRPDRLKIQTSFMEKNPDIAVCGSWVEVFGSGKNYVWKTPIGTEKIRTRLFFESCLIHSSVIISKNVIDNYDLNFNGNYKHAEDYYLWLKISEISKMNNIQKVLLDYRVHQDQVGKKYQKKQSESTKKIFHYMIKKLGYNPTQSDLDRHYNIMSWHPVESIRELSKSGDWLKGLLKLNKVSAVYPLTLFNNYVGERWAGTIYLANKLGLVRFFIFFKKKELILPTLKFYIVFLIKRLK